MPPAPGARILRKHSSSVQVNNLHCLLHGIVRTPRMRREHALIRFCRTLTHKQKILISSGAASIAVYTDQRTFWVQRGCACDRLLLYKLGTWARDRPAWVVGGARGGVWEEGTRRARPGAGCRGRPGQVREGGTEMQARDVVITAAVLQNGV